MAKEPNWNNSRDIARYNYERAKEQQYIENDNPHGTGGGSGINPFTPRRGFAVGLAMAWCWVVFQSVWGSGQAGIDAFYATPPPGDRFLVWKQWTAWVFLFASGVRTYMLGMKLGWWHLGRPKELGGLLFRWAVWVVGLAVGIAFVVGVLTLVWAGGR